MVRCKFRCESVVTRKQAGNEAPTYDATFYPVSSGSEENKKFWKYTPGGRFEVSTVLEMPWEPGKEYYFDISPAGE